MPESSVGEEREAISEEEALRRLREFLRRIEYLLADLVEHPRPALPGRHHESMRLAWDATRENFAFAIRALASEMDFELLPKLREVSLVGDALVFKLSVFEHPYNELLDHGLASDGEPRATRWWQIWRKLFNRTLRAADVILGSLAKVLPVVEAITEYKEAIESGVELGGTAAGLPRRNEPASDTRPARRRWWHLRGGA